MVENTSLVNSRNRYFYNDESVGIENPDIEMSPKGNGASSQAVYTTSPAHSRMESYKVNPMFHETKSYEQSSVAGKSSISTGQEVSNIKNYDGYWAMLELNLVDFRYFFNF
jgi:hypothetical protein